MNPEKTEYRRRLINSFVNAVYLYDDYFVFVGNYKDGTKTITFAELEATGIGSDLNALSVPKIPDTHPGIWNFLYTEGLEEGGRATRGN